MITAQRWKTFWAKQKSPLHPVETPEFYRVYAKELRILLGDRSPARVLEIGCGNGALFEFMGFDKTKYKGVDFSPRFLAEFKAKHPNVDLECCEASSYNDRGSRYDLIFSNEVLQYFDPIMLDRFFASARSMMEKDSLFVCASLLWRLLRSAYDSRGFTGTMDTSTLAKARSAISRTLFGDPMGHWYQPQEIVALASKHGFSVEFYGSMVQPYRFHAVMKFK